MKNNKKKYLSDIPLNKIKGVLIDIDDTIYSYEECHNKALKQTYIFFFHYKDIPYEVFISLYEDSKIKIKERLKNVAASHARILYFQSLCESVFYKSEVRLAAALEEVYWKNFIKHMSIYDDVLFFLKKCKQNNIKICFVTDLTAGVQFRKMVEKGIDFFADYVVSSEEVGIEKPNYQVFELALKKLCLQRGDVIMIGDDKVKDIDGARNYNIRAFWYKNGEILQGDF